MDGRPARALETDRCVEDDDGIATDADALAGLAQQPAGAAHRDALVDREPGGAGAGVRVGHQRPGGRAGRGVLEHGRAVEEERARGGGLAVEVGEIRAGAAVDGRSQ